MRHVLPILAALIVVGAASAQVSAQAQERGSSRRLPHRPLAGGLPPETPYVDPRPRFRPPPPVPRLGRPVATYAVQGYQPIPTNQPLYNEPPRPLR